MSHEYLDELRSQLPELFEDIPVEPDWDDNWYVWRTEAEDEQDLVSIVADFVGQDAREDLLIDEPPFLATPRYPGGPLGRRGDDEVSNHPDSIERLAFYLPYHFYYPTWWGIYVLFEGWVHLGCRLYHLGGRTFSPKEAAQAAKEALFRHELFHHGTEAFATRLEVAHRVPLYRLGIRDFYNRTFGTDDCTEEALANGCAIVKSAVSKPVEDCIWEFVRRSPPGYRRGVGYATASKLDRGVNDFAEELVRSSLPSAKPLSGSVWSAVSYSFTGRIRNTSQVIYLLPRRSPLCSRLPMKRIAPMTVRKLKKGLKRVGKCEPLRQGGNHEIWQSPSGSRIIIPRHPGDLATGTLRKILQQAGIDMSPSEFQAAV